VPASNTAAIQRLTRGTTVMALLHADQACPAPADCFHAVSFGNSAFLPVSLSVGNNRNPPRILLVCINLTGRLAQQQKHFGDPTTLTVANPQPAAVNEEFFKK
jgi:hypothetical protein